MILSNFEKVARGKVVFNNYFWKWFLKRKTTAWYEIGHFVEEHNKDILRISKKFIARRTKGEKEVRFTEIFPGSGDNEMTFKDDFIPPYIGK